MKQNVVEELWTGEETKVRVPTDGDAFDLFRRSFTHSDPEFLKCVYRRLREQQILYFDFLHQVISASLNFPAWIRTEEGYDAYEGSLDVLLGAGDLPLSRIGVGMTLTREGKTGSSYTLRMQPKVNTELGRMRIATQPTEESIDLVTKGFPVAYGLLQDMGYILGGN